MNYSYIAHCVPIIGAFCEEAKAVVAGASIRSPCAKMSADRYAWSSTSCMRCFWRINMLDMILWDVSKFEIGYPGYQTKIKQSCQK